MAQTLFPLLTNAPYKRYVEPGEGTHFVVMEKSRMSLFREVQLFLERDRQHGSIKLLRSLDQLTFAPFSRNSVSRIFEWLLGKFRRRVRDVELCRLCLETGHCGRHFRSA